MGKTIVYRISYPGIPRFPNKLLRQGIFNNSTAAILVPTLQPKANLGRLHRLSQHRQIVHHKYPAQEESVQDCAYCGGNKSMAVHHIDETHLPD